MPGAPWHPMQVCAASRPFSTSPAASTGGAATAPALSLSPGESARGLILDDEGGVMDLAEVSRLGDDLFLLTTPSPQPRALQLAMRGLDVQVELDSAQ